MPHVPWLLVPPFRPTKPPVLPFHSSSPPAHQHSLQPPRHEVSSIRTERQAPHSVRVPVQRSAGWLGTAAGAVAAAASRLEGLLEAMPHHDAPADVAGRQDSVTGVKGTALGARWGLRGWQWAPTKGSGASAQKVQIVGVGQSGLGKKGYQRGGGPSKTRCHQAVISCSNACWPMPPSAQHVASGHLQLTTDCVHTCVLTPGVYAHNTVTQCWSFCLPVAGLIPATLCMLWIVSEQCLAACTDVHHTPLSRRSCPVNTQQSSLAPSRCSPCTAARDGSWPAASPHPPLPPTPTARTCQGPPGTCPRGWPSSGAGSRAAARCC